MTITHPDVEVLAFRRGQQCLLHHLEGEQGPETGGLSRGRGSVYEAMHSGEGLR